jgi:hypothetical protein
VSYYEDEILVVVEVVYFVVVEVVVVIVVVVIVVDLCLFATICVCLQRFVFVCISSKKPPPGQVKHPLAFLCLFCLVLRDNM